jgi:hypothetical protein
MRSRNDHQLRTLATSGCYSRVGPKSGGRGHALSRPRHRGVSGLTSTLPVDHVSDGGWTSVRRPHSTVSPALTQVGGVGEPLMMQSRHSALKRTSRGALGGASIVSRNVLSATLRSRRSRKVN